MRLFFLEKDGWFEVEMTEKLLSSPKEELLRWIYATMDRHYYRNYLITENPEPPKVTPFNTDRLLRGQHAQCKTESSGTPPRNDEHRTSNDE